MWALTYSVDPEKVTGARTLVRFLDYMLSSSWQESSELNHTPDSEKGGPPGMEPGANRMDAMELDSEGQPDAGPIGDTNG